MTEKYSNVKNVFENRSKAPLDGIGIQYLKRFYLHAIVVAPPTGAPQTPNGQGRNQCPVVRQQPKTADLSPKGVSKNRNVYCGDDTHL